MILAHFADFTEAGIHRSHAIQAAWRSIKFPGSGRSDAFRAAKQKDRKLACPCAGLKLIEEIRSRRSFLDRQTKKAGDPDNWRAVGGTKIAVQHRFPEFRIRQAAHQEV